jgi:nucleotide-binding universal stress UspA family protein
MDSHGAETASTGGEQISSLSGRRKHEVVVGVDESPSAASALTWAAVHAVENGRPLRVVHAWAPPSRATTGLARAHHREAASADARARITRVVLATLGERTPQLRWTLDVQPGAPGPVLVERSRGALVLVIGTQEHTGLRRAVAGSVSHYCLSHVGVPVVAVPAADGALAESLKVPSDW